MPLSAMAVLVWFLLPWLEIIGRIRHMRFPLQNSVSHRFPPSRDDFPDLEALTAEIEEEGFEEAEDTGWKWQETDHFMRLLYDPERRLQATIALARQGPMAFSYVSLTSRLPDGESLITTSYPFSPTMRLAPGQRMNRMPQADSFEDLLDGHLLFLEAQSLTAEDTVEQDLETLPTILEEDMTRQIRHNLSTGLIEQTSEEEFRYSWRGCFFLWIEVVKDMLRV